MQTDIETVFIRKMQPSDVDGVTKIDEAAYGEHHWSRESFLNEIGNELAKYYALYTQDGELAGYAGCWHILEEAHITNIAVDPKFRGRKYSQALLKTLIDDCYKEKIKYITLEVRVSNSVAIKLYSKYGFTSFGIRKGYYQDNNEDAHIMWTKNIFFDEFKNNYETVTKSLEGQILIK